MTASNRARGIAWLAGFALLGLLLPAGASAFTASSAICRAVVGGQVEVSMSGIRTVGTRSSFVVCPIATRGSTNELSPNGEYVRDISVVVPSTSNATCWTLGRKTNGQILWRALVPAGGHEATFRWGRYGRDFEGYHDFSLICSLPPGIALGRISADLVP